MPKMILALVVALVTAVFTPTASSDPVPSDCMNCIRKMEYAPRGIPDHLCRDDGGSDSCGPFQIKEAYWQDAQLKGGDLMGDWQTCAGSSSCSREAVQGYMKRYATKTRLGHNPTCEDFARIHNGGPTGAKKTSTIQYWKKVKKCLDS